MNVTGMRQDPLNPCNLQIEFDGNNQWVTVADVSKCGGAGGSIPAMRYDGVNIQIFNICNGEWENQGEPTTPAIIPPIAPYPDSPSDGACNGSVALGRWFEEAKNRIMDVMIPLDIAGVIASAILAIFSELFGISVPVSPVLLWVVDTLLDGVEAFEAARAVNIADTMKCVLIRYMGKDGLIPLASLPSVANDIRALRDAETRPSGLWVALNTAVMIVNLNSAAGLATGVAFGAVEDADCSDCEWQATFDFTIAPNGFITTTEELGDQVIGDYVYGQGFVTTEHEFNGAGFTRTSCQRSFPATVLTYIKIVYNVVKGIEQAYGTTLLVKQPDWGGTVEEERKPLIDGTDQEFVFVPSEPYGGIHLTLQVGVSQVAPAGGSGRIKKIVMRGTGANPFKFG